MNQYYPSLPTLEMTDSLALSTVKTDAFSAQRTMSCDNNRAKTADEPPPAGIAVIGAAWWSQGWHLPQLERNPDAVIAAIMQRSEQPTAAAFLDIQLESKTQLRARYPGVPIFSSCEELIADADTLSKVDGVIICTAHSCHADMGMKFLAAGKHVFMEKPMTVDVAEARELAAAAAAAAPRLTFIVNNTANFRPQCFAARRAVEAGELGPIHHVLCARVAARVPPRAVTAVWPPVCRHVLCATWPPVCRHVL